ncbi:MAG: hypothetical protein ACFFD2_15890 [Promethearchaeota archaeon]
MFFLSLFIFLIVFYIFLLPIVWKVWSNLLNAAYKPSHLDYIAQPEPNQIQTNIPEVNVDESGNYEIQFGNGRKFYNGTLQIHYQREWFYAHPVNKEKTLKLISIENTSDYDIFGTYKRILMKWELEGTSIPVHSSIIIYPNQSIIKFQLEFPKGLKDVSTEKLKIPFFRFPCFNLEGPNQRVLTFRYALFAPPKRNIPKIGTQGPVVFYDNELNAAVLGPLDHFIIAFTHRNKIIFHGLEGKIKEVPEGYEHSILLLFTKGINKAIVDWCALLHKYHNTSPKDPYADPIIANLGFWTDSGAYYYYRKEKGMSYEQTITFACKVFKEQDIPIKYYQLDSWWYQKDMKSLWKYPPISWIGRLIRGGLYRGTILWEVISEEFPKGLKALYKRIGLPFACHARWFSPKSPYIQKYKSVVGKSVALPMEARFWDDLMKQSAEKGIIMYEQDWLKKSFTQIPYLQENIYAAEKWLTWMAEAANQNNISIQYCMASSGFFLYTLKFPAVTNARVGGDYNARATKRFYYPHISQTNILAWGVGVWPSFDSYLTTTTPLRKGLYREKYPDQMTLLSNLGGGLMCPADKANRVNKELLMKTCTKEGVLLKPDRPITVNDIMFKINQKPYIMDTWTQKGKLFWRYIVAVNLWPRRVKDPQITLRELGYPEEGVLYDFITKEIKEIGPDDIIDLKLKGMDYKYFIYAPFLKEGVALIGSTEKYVSCANKLIPTFQIESSSLIFTIEYSINSIIKLLIYSKVAPLDVKLKDNSASVKWYYNNSTRKLEITISFSSNNSNEVNIIFNN